MARRAIRTATNVLNAGLTRVFDIVLATILLVLTAPALGVASIGIRLASPGPVFYRARRVGRGGKLFSMLKLRTMHVNADSGAAITAPGDARVFPFGRLLRTMKLDEIPQLVNVITGDLSVVGPRPEDPCIVDEYYDERMMASLSVRPGLTSPGTLLYMERAGEVLRGDDVVKSYATGILRDKMEADLGYIDRRNALSDAWLVVRTALTVCRRLIRFGGVE